MMNYIKDIQKCCSNMNDNNRFRNDNDKLYKKETN